MLQRKNNEKGFTIIEVVLVLAIAGLIFLVVFLALPALQRSQRDTQRKQDASRFAAQIQNYQSSNKGELPTAVAGTTAPAVNAFIDSYLRANQDKFADPRGPNYSAIFTGTPTNPTDGKFVYQTGSKCDGSAITTTGAGARDWAAQFLLEGGGTFCVGS